MEDALARKNYVIFHGFCTCLNPCCNGRCTRTENILDDLPRIIVLILVVMEDALARSTK